ncbi:MAG: 16S rRNA (uracil(1498)-N(3))-methyltransferase [Alphaproteobacteria bacterium]
MTNTDSDSEIAHPMDNRPRLRLFVSSDLASNLTVRVGAEPAHYLVHVMRARAGEAVALFNGRDGEWLATLQDTGRRWCDLSVTVRSREQVPEPDLWLLFAPIKRAHLDYMVEKATELGVSRLWPVLTHRTVVTRVNVERLHAIAVEASEQTERLTVPSVREPVRLAALFENWPPERCLLVMDEWGGGRPIADVVSEKPPGPVAILVGPEGGFTKTELDVLRVLPFATAVGLGPRILRADTAALAALACWQALRGDWRASPPVREGS